MNEEKYTRSVEHKHFYPNTDFCDMIELLEYAYLPKSKSRDELNQFVKDIIEYVNGTVVECNTAYEGARNTTEKHRKLINYHGWNKYFDVDLLDAEGPDLKLEIPNGKAKRSYVVNELRSNGYQTKEIDRNKVEIMW